MHRTFFRKAVWYALDISIAIGMPIVAVWYTLNYASPAIAAATLTLVGPIAAVFENAVAKIYMTRSEYSEYLNEL